MGLVEVDCGHYVFRDESIFLPELGDAIDLDGQHHRDADAIQFAREDPPWQRPPQLWPNSMMCAGFFILAQHAVMVSIKQVKDLFASAVLPMAGLMKSFRCRHLWGNSGEGAECDLDGVMVRIVVAEEIRQQNQKTRM